VIVKAEFLTTHRHSMDAADSDWVVYLKGFRLLSKILFPVKLTTSWVLAPGVVLVMVEVRATFRFSR
jgi:hypothetical protein